MDRRGYRSDIDGLRAIAVLGVVAYHAVPGLVRGGFTGVDVFFVISGFLITQILVNDLRTDRFSFTEFYARRVRRIFPALLIVLVATLAIGWQTLYSSEFEQLGKHAAGGAAFVSNFVLQREAGYFDYGSDVKPLLHLWSLGVEEQFYLVWPVLLLIAWRLKRLDLALVVVFTISLVASLIASVTDPTAAFYFPLFRFWELACGGILAVRGFSFAGRSSLATTSGVIGLMLIAVGMIGVGSAAKYPAWFSLLPTAGACLFIAAGPASAASRLVGTRPFVAIGLISYPLYLWHWPLLTFAKILDGPLPSRQLRAAMVLASVVLATLTYLIVEHPIRASNATRRLAAGLLVVMIGVGASAYAIYASGGAPSRSVARAAEPYITTMQRSTSLARCIDIPYAHQRAEDWYCHLNASGRTARTMVFGDSHAFSLLPAFEAIARQSGEDILFTAVSGCPPLLGVVPRRRDEVVQNCRALNERVFQFAADRKLANLFFVANWTYYTDGNYAGEEVSVIAAGDTPDTRDGSREAFRRGLASTIARYASHPSMVHLVQKAPAQLRNAIDLIRDVVTSAAPAAQTIERISVPVESHRRLLQFVASEFAAQGIAEGSGRRIDLIDLDGVYCRSQVCAFAEPGVSFYLDSNHLSSSGALLAVPVLTKHLAAHLPSALMP